jgi:hypothetical protein
LKKIFVLCTLFLACNSPLESGDESLSNGTYEYTETIDSIAYAYQIQLTSVDYTVMNHVGGPVSGCQVYEERGRWKAEGKNLLFSTVSQRSRDDCNQPLSTWSNMSDTSAKIRNITAKSFEKYEPADANSPARWVKYTKI